jgi:hypothetical protein
MGLQCNDWNPVIFILENYPREGLAHGDPESGEVNCRV